MAAYTVFLAFVFFWPNSDRQSHAVVWLQHTLNVWGITGHLATYSFLEVVCNAVIVAPLTFLGAWSIRKVRWQDWTAYAFLGAVTVEAAQGALLSSRQASFSDVVSNTAGALLGAVVFRAARPMLLRTGESD